MKTVKTKDVEMEVKNDDLNNEVLVADEIDFEALFNQKIEDTDFGDKKKYVTNIYAPKANDVDGKKYTSVIRFLPNVKSVGKNVLTKKSFYLNEEEFGLSGYFDSKDNFDYNTCPIMKKFYALLKKKESDPVEYEMRKRINPTNNYYSLVYIVKDKQKPDLEGKVMIMKYGKDIHDKIVLAAKPSAEKIDVGEKAIDPFNLYKGHDFILELTTKNVPGIGACNNYESCKFRQTANPLSINGVEVGKNIESNIAITKMYNEAPLLSEQDPKKWTAEDEEKIMEFLKTLTTNKVKPTVKDKVEKNLNVKAKPDASKNSLSKFMDEDDSVDSEEDFDENEDLEEENDDDQPF